MAKKRNSKPEDTVIELVIIGIYNVIKFIAKVFSKIFGINNNNNKYIPKNNLIVGTALNDNIVEPKKKVLTEYGVTTPYDDLFKDIIMTRGLGYYATNKILKYSLKNNACKGVIKGTKKYKTEIVFYKNKKIKSAKCDCEYYKKDNKYCKHIFALLLLYCHNENIEGFIEQKEVKEEYIDDSKELLINQFLNILKSFENYYNEFMVMRNYIFNKSMYKSVTKFMTSIREVKTDFSSYQMEDITASVVKQLRDALNDLVITYNNLVVYIDGGNKINRSNYKKIQKLDDTDFNLKNKWGLMDYEIKKVKEEGYAPHSFEEEDLEDDDYYAEDPF